MSEELLKFRIGNTPLIRARRLEREIGVSKIYLKLEGNNPSGHREDRLAYLLIRDALTRGKRTICLGTYGTVGKSLAYLARGFNVRCVFYMPDTKKLKDGSIRGTDVEIIRHGKTYADCVKESRRAAEENGWYNANPGLANNVMNMYAFSYIAGEIYRQLEGEKADSVICQTSNGSSVSGLHLGFKQLWVNENIDSFPRLLGVSTAHGNAIVESFRQNSREILTLARTEIRESRYNKNMIATIAFNGQDALNAIYDTGGRVLGVSDADLLESGRRFKKLGKIRLTLANAYPIAALMSEIEGGHLEDGVHVVVLNDGMVDVDVRRVKRSDLNLPYDEFLGKLDDWLIQFSDPMKEIREAVENAFDHGYVLCAFDHETLVGITILSRTRFETFFPKYHLSYIATKKIVKGRGIATQLLQKAIDITKGDLSLHVETDNRRAIRLYEKMGLKRKYYRMIYQKP